MLYAHLVYLQILNDVCNRILPHEEQCFVAWHNKWKHPFIRPFTLLHAVLWNFFRLSSIIECCDTVRERKKRVIRGSPETAYQLTFDWLS